jgi:hypothetical protein
MSNLHLLVNNFSTLALTISRGCPVYLRYYFEAENMVSAFIELTLQFRLLLC